MHSLVKARIWKLPTSPAVSFCGMPFEFTGFRSHLSHPLKKNFLEAKVLVSCLFSKSFVLTYLGSEMPSLVFRHFKEDPSADEGTRVWVSAMMLPTGPISPTFCQGVSSLEKVITFVWVMILNPYFFKYSICSFHLFFFLGKSTYSLRVGVIVSFFDAPGQTGLSCTCCLLPSPFWCVLVHMVIIGFQARVLQEASCFSRVGISLYSFCIPNTSHRAWPLAHGQPIYKWVPSTAFSFSWFLLRVQSGIFLCLPGMCFWLWKME